MTSTLERPAHQEGPQPMVAGKKSRTQTLLVKLFAIVPLLGLVAAVPFAWGWGLGWVDVGLVLFFYTFTCLGVTVGFHRYFTHGAFKARRGLRIALAAAVVRTAGYPVLDRFVLFELAVENVMCTRPGTEDAYEVTREFWPSR
jgi:stearoyl-CoA desaturase (Delta-9 desaturase)